MPYYDFECDTCGNVIEKFYRSIPRVTPLHIEEECENCGGQTFKKMINAPAFHLKGNCWANDGYTIQKFDGSRVTGVTCGHDPKNPINKKG